MGRILAIDYGKKRVGLAVTDELKIIATALGTVHAGDVIAYLKRYLRDNKVECFVVGEPKDMTNRPSEAERFITPFVKNLKKSFPGIRVERFDERFTSRMASQAILAAGAKKSDRQNKSLVDAVSATLILQSYLESLALNS
ncbi:MAG: Holliday junction resolvase RuvX [Bacteroidales bacterium]|nr:Holliday junction resolvase RuvX [Bacteroidales bacterium]